MNNKELKISCLRLFFRKERHRNCLSILSGVIVCVLALLILWINRECLKKSDTLSNALQMSSIMAALLAGLAYNLRLQSVEYYVNSLNMGTPTHNAIKTARALTNLTILSFISAMLLLITSCMPSSWYEGTVIVASLSAGILAACCVQYIYTIFAQEKLEEEYIIKEQKAFVREVEKGNKQIPTDK